jgi:hypothetical protein
VALRPRLWPGVPLSWMYWSADSVRSGTGVVKYVPARGHTDVIPACKPSIQPRYPALGPPLDSLEYAVLTPEQLGRPVSVLHS